MAGQLAGNWIDGKSHGRLIRLVYHPRRRYPPIRPHRKTGPTFRRRKRQIDKPAAVYRTHICGYKHCSDALFLFRDREVIHNPKYANIPGKSLGKFSFLAQLCLLEGNTRVSKVFFVPRISQRLPR